MAPKVFRRNDSGHHRQRRQTSRTSKQKSRRHRRTKFNFEISLSLVKSSGWDNSSRFDKEGDVRTARGWEPIKSYSTKYHFQSTAFARTKSWRLRAQVRSFKSRICKNVAMELWGYSDAHWVRWIYSLPSMSKISIFFEFVNANSWVGTNCWETSI